MNCFSRNFALAVLVLVAATCAVVLLGGRAVSASPIPKPWGTPEAAVAANPAPSADEIPRPSATERPAAKENEPVKATPASKISAAPKIPDDRRLLLETIGALTASHSYQTYLNIGLIADGKTKGNYSERDANKILDSVISLLDTVDRKLADLAKLDLEKEDRISLDQMRRLSALLRQQGKVLQTYWDTGRDDDAAKYENARKDSWAVIGKILGIES
jgi:hypothetical protein